jgi:hypothetical protein
VVVALKFNGTLFIIVGEGLALLGRAAFVKETPLAIFVLFRSGTEPLLEIFPGFEPVLMR